MSKRILRALPCLLTLFGCVTNAHAVAAGFYVGAQGAYARTNPENFKGTNVADDTLSVSTNTKQLRLLVKSAIAPSLQIVASPVSFPPPISINSFNTSSSPNVFLGRFFFGYQFLPWIGAEMGFFGTSNATADYDAIISAAPGTAAIANVRSINGVAFSGTFTANYSTVTRSDQLSKAGVDFFIKLMFPVYDQFDAYLKLGGAYLRTTVDSQIKVDRFVNGFFTPAFPGPFPGNGTYFSNAALKVKTSVTNSKLAPAFSIGASYYYQSNLGIDLSYTQVGGTTQSGFNYIALGIAYHLVDKFCGQFLCD